jgi:general secretion pathway protein D
MAPRTLRLGLCLLMASLAYTMTMHTPVWALSHQSSKAKAQAGSAARLNALALNSEKSDGSDLPRLGQSLQLNFVNAEIEAVARTIALITGHSIIIDPRVKGTMTLVSEKPLLPQVALQQFLSTLRLYGHTVVEAEGFYKVLPEADAKLQSAHVEDAASLDKTPTKQTLPGQIVTRIFRLNYESANNLVPILRPLISPNNLINISPAGNALVVTDYRDNLERLARMLVLLDTPNSTDIKIVTLKYAIATDVYNLLSRLMDVQSGAPGAGDANANTRPIVVPDTRSNSLLVRAPNAYRLVQTLALIDKLDQPAAQHPTANIYIIHLKHADATKLASTLRAALSGNAATTAGAGTGPTVGAPAVTTGGQIQADVSTNSLIVTAPEPQYRQIEEVVRRLDTVRPQVFVESLIVEVSASKIEEMGVQWQGPLGENGNGVIGVLGTNFGAAGQNILNLALNGTTTTPTLPTTGFNFGLLSKVNGKYSLTALAHFLETQGEGNILSTPNLLTLDNEEAKIVIGQNVPFLTGQYSNATNGSTVTPFQTYDRKDVGLTLRIKPQVNDNNLVKMQIFQEVSTIDPSSVNSAAGLITAKRSIESNIVVDDGSVVVLGGLLQDQDSKNKDQVPGLGDLPFIGGLFRNSSTTHKKTNLMVFLRPVVLRSTDSSQRLTDDRYQNILKDQSNPRAMLDTPVSPKVFFRPRKKEDDDGADLPLSIRRKPR